MEKPIIATNLNGLLIEHKAFIEPHKDWFDRAIEKTGDISLANWKGKEDYFKGVNLAMEKIMPDATQEQRTEQARKWYQEDVIKYIQENPQVIKKDVVEKLRNLKEKFELILLTTNTLDHINKILEVSKLQGIYNKIIASKTEKEPNKKELITELINKYGIPKYYITGKQDSETIKKFKELGTNIITEKEIDKII